MKSKITHCVQYNSVCARCAEKKPWGKMKVERKPGGRKAWWKKSLVCFEKHGKKPGVSFFSVHIMINDKVKVKH